MDRAITLTYNGVELDMEDHLVQAVTLDACGGEYDTLKLRMDNVGDWMQWTPAEDDCVTLACGEYRTGEMYVDQIQADDKGYTLLLRSCPTLGEKKWACYENVSLVQLVALAAEDMGIAYALYGTTGQQRYERIWRRNENWPAFLARITKREGAALKYSGGKLLVIDWRWAFTQNAVTEMEIQPDTKGVKYRVTGKPLRTLTVQALLGSGTAEDINAAGTLTRTEAEEPVFDDAQAARWARGLLLSNNLNVETIHRETTLETGLAALSRAEVTGLAVLSGAWMITRTEHDFIRGSTTTVLCRCQSGI